jgi:hypothetical protein
MRRSADGSRTIATTGAVAALAVSTVMAGSVAGTAAAPVSAATRVQASAKGPAQAVAGTPRCRLRHGVKHVITLVFDNVHFARDNPDVPSDVEQMPHLLHFLTRYGTVFSNTHTPMIAHTADDSLSIYTGLYGDRHGQPLTNSYRTYNPDGSSDPAGSFAYWTDPVYDTASTPTTGHDKSPTMVYSPTVPARSGHTGRQTPAPWVPFTRAGCTVGDFSTANMVLENTKLDLPTVFGPGSPEVAQYNHDPDPFKDDETTDYVGVAVHCARHDSTCSDARAVKYGQSDPSPTAVADRLPTEPGGYHHFQALFGARYADPQLGAGTPNLFHHGYRVTDANGTLVDLSGQPLVNAFTGKPGFVGFNPTATQSLAYLADMQEAGIPVTYGYISDLHEVKPFDTGTCTTASANDSTGAPKPGRPIGPGDSCYAQNARAYDQAFATFFRRLRADGITPKNTVFQISAEENDQFAGANVGRATTPTPAGCTGGANPCHYATDQIGELTANIDALLAGTPSASTSYDIEPQGASIYAHGRPAADDPTVRQLERDTGSMRADNLYSGAQNQRVVKYQAGALEERVLHMRTADPLRTPTYTLFPVPDYYFSRGSATGPKVTIQNGFAWNHGYYTPNIDITWSSFVGPRVAPRGIDGPAPAGGNEARDPNSHHTVPQASHRGTWVEETDLRPTLMWLTGLRDDYAPDGTVVTAALRHVPASLRDTRRLARVYRQLNSAVGRFATNTLIADSRALRSGTGGDDSTYTREQRQLRRLAGERDWLAGRMKVMLHEAAHHRAPSRTSVRLATRLGHHLLRQSAQLRRSVP